jgi:hypothetical protein
MGQGIEKIIFYNFVHPGHLARDCQNPFTTYSYCNSFEHVIEEGLALLAKLQERRRPQKNSQVQLIYVETRRNDPRFIVITRGGAATREDRTSQGKNADNHGVRKSTENTPMFEAKKERQIFEEVRKEFKGYQGSSYRM